GRPHREDVAVGELLLGCQPDDGEEPRRSVRPTCHLSLLSAAPVRRRAPTLSMCMYLVTRPHPVSPDRPRARPPPGALRALRCHPCPTERSRSWSRSPSSRRLTACATASVRASPTVASTGWPRS